MQKIMLFLTALLLSCSGFAAIDALNFQSAQQEQDYHVLTQELRCPQCQNNNIADSNAQISIDMRAKVFELLQEGKSKRDVVDYMVERYGNFVTYNPPLTPATLWLWLLPCAFVILGAWFVVRRKKVQTTNGAERQCVVKNPEDLDDSEQRRLQSILNEKE
ncbi:cytochrome C biogenesis protein [Actinobacillus succinogenes 130Z]|uniref:Cytochrome c-type biogenesis protein n=1 Tax=Actinobacillus succinogenes (strain ATCC 55618 / DSM 22257 / CCUG 43843 / 130Z) TaxID=339671 RepID=A6VMM3_ACTSZ|nr:cytochrome c-type biogenesis protein [Actinobacillus succinogenes]ABR74220.1 cytochrome C biogenesis protein [Actinobacillus succinogenes 130Z]